MKYVLIPLVFMSFFSGCAYLGYVRDHSVDIPNFYQVNETLYRGGQPDQQGLLDLKNKEIKTIINLCFIYSDWLSDWLYRF